jgi:hypothetical protein
VGGGRGGGGGGGGHTLSERGPGEIVQGGPILAPLTPPRDWGFS